MAQRFVSIIVPCRNEERFISDCVKSILNQDYPREKLEVFIVDGMSTDRTREIVQSHKLQTTNYKLELLDNPKVITPSAMNIGIKNAKGEVIIKMDAHSIYDKDYISKCVEHLIESGADNVGGVLKAVPSKNTLTAKAIAISLSHFFGAGGSYFRTGTDKPREVDTVAFGCYWKRTFDKIGLYDERMAQIEDLELNYRLGKAGGKIMLFPDIKAIYYPSSDNLVSFFKHNFTDGIWATYPLKYGFKVSLRHLIPLIFVLTLPLSIWPYIVVSLFFSLQIAARENKLRLFFIMPLVFFTRHFGYGFGSMWGLVRLLF
ncbi:MAG: glycosyltransferase family 2 protein [Candidatus Staskawiczbacteria bacterium]|nr:glycosyltransferase family 2 protein [Candidatus Staskawiczbacteria bacterium]